ncbi:MAG: acyltransferase [Gammaproteobacteria bacterium]|nr:MAG: acyltransferase [Gammaproteobacteria bacterium]
MLKSNLARAFLRLSGWAFEGEPPAHRRYVLIAAPHTSNWDFVFMIAMACSLGLRLNWMGKAELFESPIGGLYRALGGIPIQRDVRSNLVEQSAARFAGQDDLVLAVPAEGTRRLGTTWRSGFYHIARMANVPIILGHLDYARKRGGLGPAVIPSGDVGADMDRIRAFYADKIGRHPGQFTPPRLAEEFEVHVNSDH